MRKKIIFKQKTDLEQIEKKIDEWVLDSTKTSSLNTISAFSNNIIKIEDTRFTIVIPTYMHRRIKKYCASKGVSIKNKLIEIFEKEFPET